MLHFRLTYYDLSVSERVGTRARHATWAAMPYSCMPVCATLYLGVCVYSAPQRQHVACCPSSVVKTPAAQSRRSPLTLPPSRPATQVLAAMPVLAILLECGAARRLFTRCVKVHPLSMAVPPSVAWSLALAPALAPRAGGPRGRAAKTGLISVSRGGGLSANVTSARIRAFELIRIVDTVHRTTAAKRSERSKMWKERRKPRRLVRLGRGLSCLGVCTHPRVSSDRSVRLWLRLRHFLLPVLRHRRRRL